MTQLAWMGDKRPFLESLMRLLNTYARQYNRSYVLQGTAVTISSAQIQTLEAIFEAPADANMSENAARMGITRGTFSNNIKKLQQLGFLEKNFGSDNQKDIHLEVSSAGERAYNEYAEFIRREAFAEIFALLDRLPPENRQTLLELLDALTGAFNLGGRARGEPPGPSRGRAVIGRR